LKAKEIVDVAETALQLGMVEIGQALLDAAYDIANGLEVTNVKELVDSVTKTLGP
jgi:hypothetical protein